MGVLNACRPRPDVLQSDLSDAIFAAEFGDVLNGTAPKVYQDPKVFFQNTHPTRELQRVARVVFERLRDPSEGGGLVRLSTGYGGGKSHTLMALWHIACKPQDPEIGGDLVPLAARPAGVAVAAVDARAAGVPNFAIHDGVRVGSLAGEIAYQLGGKAALEALGEADHPEASPSEDQIAAVFPEGPVLILLDELVVYMAKLSPQGQGNLMGFLATLAGIVARRPQTVLVVTDPAHQRSYQDQARRLDEALQQELEAASKLDDIYGRRFSDYDPIGDESAQVISRRLFESVDPQAADRTAQEYRALYERVRSDHPELLPTGAESMEYAERMRECYPFHPRLMETARERLGALEDFQKSRGVLRLFARLLRDLWERGEDVPLITAGDVNFSDRRIRADLLDRLNRDRFAAAVGADLERHAAELDGDAGRGVHVRAASAVLLESLPMGQNAGLDEQELTLAVLRPDEAGPEPAEAMQRLEGVCWHLYPRSSGGWVFRYEPNVLKQIEERTARIPREDARKRVLAEVQAYFQGPLFAVAAWPGAPHDVAESAKLQLVLCDDLGLARRVVQYADDRDPDSPMPRRFENAIVAVSADPSALDNAIERARRLMALEEIEREARGAASGDDVSAQLVREQVKRLKPNLQKQFRIQARRAFDQVVTGGPRVHRLDERYLGSEDELLSQSQGQRALREFLEDKRLIYRDGETIGADFLLDEILPKATSAREGVWTARAVHERILSAPGLRLVPDAGLVRSSLLEAVRAGKIVLRTGEGTAYDMEGCVTGPPGRRMRTKGTPPSSLPLDETVEIARAGGPAAQEWLEETGSVGEPGPEPAMPPPPPQTAATVTATTRERIAALAHRPLRRLKLTASSPDRAAELADLALPLGAARLELTVEVRGSSRSGGNIVFEAAGVALNDAVRPLELARAVRDALPAEGREYRATLVLLFGEEGRPGLAAQLERLTTQTPDEVGLEAEFGPEPSGGDA